MKTLIYAFCSLMLCAGLSMAVSARDNAASSQAKVSQQSSLTGVWKGYLFSQNGKQSRIYAVFDKGAVRLLTPSTPWVTDEDALCALSGAGACSREVAFFGMSLPLALEPRDDFYANSNAAQAGQYIKLSQTNSSRMEFFFRKDGLVREDYTGYLDTRLGG